MNINKDRLIKPIYIYLTLYFLVNLLFLDKFPKMHSDESWLSGLSRSMMAGGFDSTEYFFDLFPRSPHAIKIVFHMLQIVFISIFGYSLFTVRLISLIISIASLIVFYKLAKLIFDKNKYTGLILTIILSLDIQFLYASHFARQETAIVFFALFAVYYLLKVDDWKMKNDIILGVIIGLSIGFHPNSFIIALIAGAIYLYKILFEKKLKFRNLLTIILAVGFFASIFIGLSLLLNLNFYHDYYEFGKTVGVDRTFFERITYIFNYYKMLFKLDSVTYYMAPIKMQMILFAISTIISVILIFIKKASKELTIFLVVIVTINIGYIIIGRYSQPTIVFIFPFAYLISFLLLCKITNIKTTYILCALILIGTVFNTASELKKEINDEYKEYLSAINEHIPEDSIMLANLNVEYASSYNGLYDYRNLAYLKAGQFDDYIDDRSIEYIVFPQEMEYIYKNRPVWNIVYGNVYPYYDDMIKFLDENCELVYNGKSDYAMRILKLLDDRDWEYSIYKVVR